MGNVGYYDQEFEPWVRGIRSIGSMIAQGPALRAMAQERQHRAQLTDAQIGTEQAQTGQINAETQMLVKKGQLVTRLEQVMPQAQQDIIDGRTDTPAVREFSGAVSAMTGLNGDDIIEQARKGIGTLLARQGKVTEGAAVESPVEIEKARIGANRGMVVQPGGAVWNPVTGKADYENPSAASRQAVDFEEEVIQYPEVPGTPGTPGTPAKKANIFGFGAKPATPGTPGTPGTPSRTIRRRRTIGDAAASQEQDPDDSEAPGRPLDKATAKALLDEVGGDKAKARELAKQRGYTF